MKKILLMMTTFMLIGFTGCSNFVDTNKMEMSAESKSNEQIAKEYIEKSIKIDAICNSREVCSSEYPSFIYDVCIVDEDDNQLSFSDFSEEEKKAFYESWVKSEENELLKKLEENSDLAEMLAFENMAFEITEENVSRAILSKPDVFFKRYQNNLQALLKKNAARSSKSGDKTITNDCNVASSVKKMHENYKKGRILVCSDTSSSSGSSFIGHASMMHSSRWDDSWNTNALGKATVTSYPKNNSSDWEGKTDGVQYEPIGLWAGDSDGSSQKVTIYNVGKSKWVWDWADSHYKFTDAPVSDYNAAADFAVSQIGKSYNWNFLDKNNENSYYCSSLCYKSWYKQSSSYDISMGFIASPANIASSHNTRSVCSYKNY